MDVLEQVLARAAADPGVLGVILTGSRARGTETVRSDYDVTIVVADQAQPWRHNTRTGRLDEVVATVAALADTSVHWQRYSYRGAKVLVDRLDGGIAQLVDRQARLSAKEAARRARTNLDAYVNQLYRCVKSPSGRVRRRCVSRRSGEPALAAGDSVRDVRETSSL